MAKNKAFTYDEESRVLAGGALVPGGGEIQIVGTTIDAITGGDILSIQLEEIDGAIYKYEVRVLGKDKVFEHRWKLGFTDESGDTYHLTILSPVKENHYVDYTSDEPAIVSIELAKA